MVRVDLSLFIGLFCWTYGFVCLIKGGTHVRGKGWVSKYTNPKSYLINQLTYLILGAFMVISNFIFK